MNDGKVWMVLCLLALLPAALPAQAGESAPAPQVAAVAQAATHARTGNRVEYHGQSDAVDVRVTNMPLTSVLRVISMQSGVQILMDPAADRNTTITLKDVPLDTALKRLARGLNYSFVYDNGKKHAKAPLLVSMSILPSGKQSSDYMQPVTDPLREAVAQMGMSNATYLSSKRWQARLARMPASEREKLLKAAKKLKKTQMAEQAMHAQHTQKIRKHIQALRAEMQKSMEEMKRNNPTLYQARQQQNQQEMQQVMQEIQQRSQQQQQPAGK